MKKYIYKFKYMNYDKGIRQEKEKKGTSRAWGKHRVFSGPA